MPEVAGRAPGPGHLQVHRGAVHRLGAHSLADSVVHAEVKYSSAIGAAAQRQGTSAVRSCLDARIADHSSTTIPQQSLDGCIPAIDPLVGSIAQQLRAMGRGRAGGCVHPSAGSSGCIQLVALAVLRGLHVLPVVACWLDRPSAIARRQALVGGGVSRGPGRGARRVVRGTVAEPDPGCRGALRRRLAESHLLVGMADPVLDRTGRVRPRQEQAEGS